MSFSISARGATVALLVASVAAKMAEVVQSQPVHAHDEKPVKATVEAYAGLIPEDETRDYVASVAGFLSWEGNQNDDPRYVGANISVYVRLDAKE